MTIPCVGGPDSDSSVVMALDWGYTGTNNEMPQTVPSAGYSPQCDYDFATNNFDLSLLTPVQSSPTTPYTGEVDGEVPYSPTNLQQLIALLGDPTQSPPPMFPQSPPAMFPMTDSYSVKMEPMAPTPHPESLSTGWENQPTFLSPVASPPYNFVKREEDEAEEVGSDGPADHKLLREVLKDTTFQKKYNLKPFDIGGLAVGFVGGAQHKKPCKPMDTGETEGDLEQLDRDTIEPMLSLAIEQMRKDIDATCSVLGISPDPTCWSSGEVRSWIKWTADQFNLSPVDLNHFDIEGRELAALPEDELQRRDPQNGALFFAQLEIWRTACSTPVTTPSAPASEVALSPGASYHFQDDDQVMVATPESMMVNSPHSGMASSASSADTSDDEDEDGSGATATVSPGASGQSSNAASVRGAHIHLWQFLKELLCAPNVHGSCVRWLDRPQGVFKIEDSVRVARLWGARKNRPAMNYDKLSRSIRQYYKKGIMRKTERSQRLVYQFCHPYSL